MGWSGSCLSGAPNPASTADLDVYSVCLAIGLRAFLMKLLVAHPGAVHFDLPGFVDSIALGQVG